MSVKYIKNPSGRGVLLRDARAIAQLEEKNELQSRLDALQTQIDKLVERISRLEGTQKD